MTDETPDLTRLPEVMPLAFAAQALGVKPPTLKRAIDRGELRASPIVGRGTGQLHRWVVQREDVLAYLDVLADEALARTPRRTPTAEAVLAAPPRRRRRKSTDLDLPLPDRRAA